MSLDQTLEVIRLLGDATRLRLLAALEGEELTVQELQRILELPQSRVSTHLGRLREAGLAADRVDGPHRYYRLVDHAMPPATKVTWQALRATFDDDPQLERDRQRRDEILGERSNSTWVDRVAGSLDRHYSPGRTWEALARSLALLPSIGVLADLGSGDGAIAELLAASAKHIYCVDKSPRMVDAGQRRLAKAGVTNVEFLAGDMHEVPLADHSVDFVLLLQSLQYADQPARVIKESARILRPHGTMLLVTLAAHAHDDVRATYGHVHLGFRPAHLKRWIDAASLHLQHLGPAGRERRPPQFEALVAVAHKHK